MADNNYDDKYLDLEGLQYLWTKINQAIDNKEIPIASDTEPGAVLVGAGLKIDENGVLQLSGASTSNDYTDEEKAKLSKLSNYSLPAATSRRLGGVKIGEGLQVDLDGTLSAADEFLATNTMMNLKWDDIPDTTQEIVFDSNDNLSKVVHLRNNTLFRTDVFTYSGNLIREVRTLATGEKLTIVINTETLVTTTTYTAA